MRKRSGIFFGFSVAAGLLVALVSSAKATAQTGRWADANDAVAKQLIEAERKWAVLECEPSNVMAEAMADDFVGTSPAGRSTPRLKRWARSRVSRRMVASC